jgi:hypothetical protein
MPPAALDSVEQTLDAMELENGGLSSMDENTLDSPSGIDTAPTFTEDARPDLDTEMPDAAPTFTNTSALITEVPNSLLMQPTEPDVLAAVVPSDAVDGSGNEETITSPKPYQENTEARDIEETALSGDGSTSEAITEANPPAAPVAPNITTPLVDPSMSQDIVGPSTAFTDEQAVSAPDSAKSQADQPILQTQEENEANSPDLYSGLEAALDQDGPSAQEPNQPKSEASG